MLDAGGMDDSVDGEDPGHDGAHEDRGDDEPAGALFGASGAKDERRAERDRGESVAGVVDQVGEQRDAAGGDVDRGLEQRGGAEHGQAAADRREAVARAGDSGVHEPVAVGVPVLVGIHSVPFWPPARRASGTGGS